MNISRFGIGFRFDSVENGDEREHAFNLIFSAIERADVRGLQLFAGHFPVDESDDKNIFTVAFAGGGIKQTRSLFEKLNDNPLVSGAACGIQARRSDECAQTGGEAGFLRQI